MTETGFENKIKWCNSKGMNKYIGCCPCCIGSGICHKWWRKSNNSKRKTMRSHRTGKKGN